MAKDDGLPDAAAPVHPGPKATGLAAYYPLLVEQCGGIRRWMLHRAIFINVPYTLIALALLAMVARGVFANSLYVFPTLQFVLVIAAWLVTAGIYTPAIVHLSRSSAHFEKFIAEPDAAHLEKALASQKAFWKYHGIYCTIMVIPTAIVLAAVVLMAGPWA